MERRKKGNEGLRVKEAMILQCKTVREVIVREREMRLEKKTGKEEDKAKEGTRLQCV